MQRKFASAMVTHNGACIDYDNEQRRQQVSKEKRAEPVYAVLGEWMKAQRAKIDLSQETLAAMLQCTAKSIRHIESGKVRVLLHVYENIRNLLDDDKLKETQKKARLFFSEELPVLDSKAVTEPKYTDEQYKAMGEFMRPAYESGLGHRKLAERYDITVWTVRRSLKAAGIETRKPPKATETLEDSSNRTEAVTKAVAKINKQAPNQSYQISEGVWNAIWGGKVAKTDFNSKGAADAWLASCDAAGKWRA